MHGKLHPEFSVIFGASVMKKVWFFLCLSLVWLLCYHTQLYATSGIHGGEYQAVCYAAVWYIGTNTFEDSSASVFGL